MTKEQILEHIRNAPILPLTNEWADIADMYADALSTVAEKLSVIEMAEFVAVGMLVRRKCVAAEAATLDGRQASLF
jgi:hypothetical protein